MRETQVQFLLQAASCMFGTLLGFFFFLFIFNTVHSDFFFLSLNIWRQFSSPSCFLMTDYQIIVSIEKSQLSTFAPYVLIIDFLCGSSKQVQ